MYKKLSLAASFLSFLLLSLPQKSEAMTTLYLVRHGETVDNQRQIMQGQTQGKLNETGIRQAEELREKLAGEGIDVYVSSDLYRSIETCRIIMGEGANMITTPLLRERDWGGFTGRYIPELKDEVWPDDIETLDALKKRAQCFLNFIRESYPESKVLAVGHGIINKAIQSVYFDKPMNEVPRMMNAEVRVLML
jgi:probable phosphoglycerate mutase